MLFTELEKALLETMCQRASPAESAVLEEQLKQVTVQQRENTGVGFYTQLQVGPVAGKTKNRVVGNVFANVAGLQNPMTFLLFTKDGVVDFLEGATTEESTTNIDFSQVKFEILPPR